MAISNTVIDHENKILTVAGKNIILSEREFSLFMLFYENPEAVLTKDELLEKVWSGNAGIGGVAVLVLKLRRKLEFAENIIGSIENDYGTGYHLAPPKAHCTASCAKKS